VLSRVKSVAAPRTAALLYIALILPSAFSLTVGGLRLTLYRILLLAVTVPLLLRLFQNRTQPPHSADYLMIAHAFWVVLAFTVYGGVSSGLESGGIYAVESLGAYLVGRMVVTNAAEFKAVLKFMLTVLGVMLVFTLPESLTATHFIREVSGALVGGPAVPYIDPRWGLERAFGSFDHPILYGVFAASTFSAAYYVLGEEKLSYNSLGLMGLVALSAFLSLSAGPFVGLACQIGLIGWDRITKGISMRWWLLASIVMLMFLAISLGSNRSPVHVFISYLTFSPTSAYNRILIWEYGSAEVARNPIFGIGFGDWIRAPWMSDSMDNFWLLTAVRYGLPALLFLVGAILSIALTQHRATDPNPSLRRYRMTWLIVMIGFVVSGVTVHFWNSVFAYFFFLIGTGSWMTFPQNRTDEIRRLLVNQLAQLKPHPQNAWST